MMATSRTALLVGILTGTCLGSVAGFFAGRTSNYPFPSKSPDPKPKNPTLRVNSFPRVSFAQEGEDIIMDQMVAYFGIDHPSYLDIGAHDPIIYNNTFLFY